MCIIRAMKFSPWSDTSDRSSRFFVGSKRTWCVRTGLGSTHSPRTGGRLRCPVRPEPGAQHMKSEPPPPAPGRPPPPRSAVRTRARGLSSARPPLRSPHPTCGGLVHSACRRLCPLHLESRVFRATPAPRRRADGTHRSRVPTEPTAPCVSRGLCAPG